MRIISKFKDYYDFVSKYGVDTSIIYTRNTKKVEDKILINSLPEVGSLYPYKYNITEDLSVLEGYLLFCGKRYNFIRLYVHTPTYGIKKPPVIPGTLAYFYSYEQINTWLLKYFKNSTPAQVDSITSKYHNNETSKELINSYFNAGVSYDYNELHSTLHSPLVVVYDTIEISVYTNPKLKELQFYKIKSAIDVFQYISSYISGVLGVSQVKEVAITDSIKIQKHGFDIKKSFRRDKSN